MAATGPSPSSSRRSTAPLEDGKLYTLDPCPNDWYGYWLRPGRQRAVRRAAERPLRPAGYNRRLPATGPGCRARRRSWPDWTPSTRPGCCTTSRPASGSSSAGTAGRRCCWCRDRQAPAKVYQHRLRRVRPAPGGDEGRSTVPGLPVVQDPRRHRRAAEERPGGPGEAAGTPGLPTRSCSPSTSTPGSSTCRSTGWPQTTRRLLA